MNGFLDFRSANFLGGQNVQNIVIIGLGSFIAYQMFIKNKK